MARAPKQSAPTPKKKISKAASKIAETPPFERVWRIIRRVPKGKVTTYGQISELIDKRLTPVGVGWAIRAAPEGLVPWHRVVNGQGAISTDREHPGLQRQLLEAEGVAFDREGRIDLARFGFRPRSSG
jgi:methylated-DNA-protein-cysteine methyltransferase-like protein